MLDIEHTCFWRRLDVPGLDAAYFGATSNGWRLCGTAIFAGEAGPCHLGYAVDVDAHWQARSAHVFGTVGGALIDRHLAASAEHAWTLDGTVQPQAAGCLDVDLGFTTAPRLFTLRRLALADGQDAVAPVAQLSLDASELVAVRESYLRLHRHAFRFTTSAGGPSTVLAVDAQLAVLRYPGRWDSDAFRAAGEPAALPAAAMHPVRADHEATAPANVESLRPTASRGGRR